jgi:hypothetical protein
MYIVDTFKKILISLRTEFDKLSRVCDSLAPITRRRYDVAPLPHIC